MHGTGHKVQGARYKVTWNTRTKNPELGTWNPELGTGTRNYLSLTEPYTLD